MVCTAAKRLTDDIQTKLCFHARMMHIFVTFALKLAKT